MPRVIAGIAKKTPLTSPKGLKTRPTSDRVKEACFSRIESYFNIKDAEILDCFAGTGQMGIEALSRGAKHAIFVDRYRDAIACVQANLKKTKLEDAASLLCQDVSRALGNLKEQNKTFDVIFCDPPYDDVESFLEKSAMNIQSLLKPEGFFILESRSQNRCNINVIEMKLFKHCIYGDTMLSFYHQ